MSSHSRQDAAPEKNGRTAKRKVEGDISPDLRDQITLAAQRIRRAHDVELADPRKADRAARLFRSIVRANGDSAGPSGETAGVSGDGSLAGELGALLGSAVRAGSGILAVPLSVLSREWLGMVLGLTVNRTAPGQTPRAQQRSAVTPPPSPIVNTEAPAATAPEVQVVSPQEAMMREVFTRFMPMLVNSINQGGDGYELAGTVITLFGRPIYDQACGLGKDKMMQIVETEPELWAQVAPIQAKFSKLLDEFLDYDVRTEARTRQATAPPD